MRRCLPHLALMFAATTAAAEDCGELGIPNAYLGALFCAELREMLVPSATTRGIPDDGITPDAAWSGIEILRDAYRADPKKTLELIRRIKDAGGLASE